jgi:putative transposase
LPAAFDLIDEGLATPERIPWCRELRDRFTARFLLVKKHNDQNNPDLPFRHLAGDGFWQAFEGDGSTPIRREIRVADIGRSWEANWDQLPPPFFHFPPEIRRISHTTNAIESLNSSFRKISRHRNLFPTIDSLFKLFYLSLKNISAKWTQTIPNWPGALSHFTIEFADRMPDPY